MIARRPSFISFLSALTLCAVASAAAATYDNLFVFGDSTVDSGWWAAHSRLPPSAVRSLHPARRAGRPGRLLLAKTL